VLIGHDGAAEATCAGRGVSPGAVAEAGHPRRVVRSSGSGAVHRLEQPERFLRVLVVGATRLRGRVYPRGPLPLADHERRHCRILSMTGGHIPDSP
jgi:hypothetical protein